MKLTAPMFRSIVLSFFIFSGFLANSQSIYYLNKSGTFLNSTENASTKIEVIPEGDNVFSLYLSELSDNKWTKPEFAQKAKKVSDSLYHFYENEKMKGDYFTREILEKNGENYTIKQNTPEGKLQFICGALEIFPLRMHGKCTRYDQEDLMMSEELYINGRKLNETLLFQPFDTLKTISKEPEFAGGIKEFKRKIATSIKYPISAMKNNQGGKVYAKFLINEQGKIEQIKEASVLASPLSKELIRAISSIKDTWIPAECDGEKIAVWYYATVQFNGAIIR